MVDMTTYRAWLFAESALSMGSPRRVRFRDHEVLIADRLQHREPVRRDVHLGLWFRVDVEAQEPTAGMAIAFQVASLASDLMSLSHAVATHSPQPHVIMDTVASSPDRQFVQFFRDLPSPVQQKRIFKEAQFRPILESGSVPQTVDEQNRVRRALHLLRRSYVETDPMDQFQDIWVALESINPLITIKFHLPSTVSGPLCQNCGTRIRVAESSAGIKYSVMSLAGETEEQWKVLKRTRRDVVHGLGSNADLGLAVSRVIESARVGLICGLLELLEIPKSQWAVYRKRPHVLSLAAPLVISSTLRGFAASRLDALEDPPCFEVSVTEISSEGRPGIPGRKKVSFSFDFVMRNTGISHDKPTIIALGIPVDPEDKTVAITNP